MSGAPPPLRSGESGRYELFFADQICGEERYEWLPTPQGGFVVTAEQTLEAPHPLAGQQRFRAALSPEGRVLSVEVDWLVGTRALHAQHRAEGGLWHVRIDYAGHVREQQGDYPPSCQVLFGSPLFQRIALRHYVLAPGAEHEFGALLIGPPYMAVEPGKQQVRCTEARALDTPLGPIEARRIEILDPAGADLPVVLWIDSEERVLESRDGLHDNAPLLLRLVELVAD